jgi:hypothetical protein
MLTNTYYHCTFTMPSENSTTLVKYFFILMTFIYTVDLLMMNNDYVNHEKLQHIRDRSDNVALKMSCSHMMILYNFVVIISIYLFIGMYCAWIHFRQFNKIFPLMPFTTFVCILMIFVNYMLFDMYNSSPSCFINHLSHTYMTLFAIKHITITILFFLYN